MKGVLHNGRKGRGQAGADEGEMSFIVCRRRQRGKIEVHFKAVSTLQLLSLAMDSICKC